MHHRGDPLAPQSTVATPPPGPAPVGGVVVRERLGYAFTLSLVWLLFEFGRPPTPPGIPLLISAVLFLTWIGKRNKQMGKYAPWWFVLLGVTAIGIPIAANWYATYFATRWMATLFLGVCLPLQSLLTSVKKVRIWVLTFIGVTFYVGAWAALHRGFGPSGSGGAQDENYVACLMGMGVALAYFSLFIEKNRFVKAGLIGCIVVFVAAIAVGENPSRGGFLGLIAVGAYCWWRSPRKILGLSFVAVAAIAMVAFAGPTFWAEIATSTDYESGTGDVRIELWKMGLRMFRANPLLGVGGGNFRWVLGDYQSAEQYVIFHRNLTGTMVPHSLPIELVAELGGLGLLATAALVWFTWAGLGKIRLKKLRPGPMVDPELVRLSYYADAIRAGILAVVLNGVFLSLLYFSHLWVFLAVGSALPFVYRRILAQGQGIELPRPGRVRGAPVRGNPAPVLAPSPQPVPSRLQRPR